MKSIFITGAHTFLLTHINFNDIIVSCSNTLQSRIVPPRPNTIFGKITVIDVVVRKSTQNDSRVRNAIGISYRRPLMFQSYFSSIWTRHFEKIDVRKCSSKENGGQQEIITQSNKSKNTVALKMPSI